MRRAFCCRAVSEPSPAVEFHDVTNNNNSNLPTPNHPSGHSPGIKLWMGHMAGQLYASTTGQERHRGMVAWLHNGVTKTASLDRQGGCSTGRKKGLLGAGGASPTGTINAKLHVTSDSWNWWAQDGVDNGGAACVSRRAEKNGG